MLVLIQRLFAIWKIAVYEANCLKMNDYRYVKIIHVNCGLWQTQQSSRKHTKLRNDRDCTKNEISHTFFTPYLLNTDLISSWFYSRLQASTGSILMKVASVMLNTFIATLKTTELAYIRKKKMWVYFVLPCISNYHKCSFYSVVLRLLCLCFQQRTLLWQVDLPRKTCHCE